jgi:hypothetical protein
MICGRCRLSWDISDWAPPACRSRQPSSPIEVVADRPAETIGIRANVPETLPDALVDAMVRTYRANESRGACEAMRLAYRVFLDEVVQ